MWVVIWMQCLQRLLADDKRPRLQQRFEMIHVLHNIDIILSFIKYYTYINIL